MSRKRRVFRPHIVGVQGTLGKDVRKALVGVNKQGQLEAKVFTQRETIGETREKFSSTDPRDVLNVQSAIGAFQGKVVESDATASQSAGAWVLTITCPVSSGYVEFGKDANGKSVLVPSQTISNEIRHDLRMKSLRLGFKCFFRRKDENLIVQRFLSQSSNPYWIEETDSAYYVPEELRELHPSKRPQFPGTMVVDINISGTLSSEAYQEITCQEYALRHGWTFLPTGSGTDEFMPEFRKPGSKPARKGKSRICPGEHSRYSIALNESRWAGGQSYIG